MAKVKTAFFCSSCGTQFSKWLGQCTACKQWNTIVEEVVQKAQEKVEEAKGQNADYSFEEKKEISTAVAISALKFADLSIYRMKDYIFDPDKFCSFEGKTGPYLLYTITRAPPMLSRKPPRKQLRKRVVSLPLLNKTKLLQ